MKAKKRKAKKGSSLQEGVEAQCPYCGEMGFIGLDEGGGEHQSFVDDCTVCCRPRVVHVDMHAEEGEARVWLEREGG